MKTTTPEFSKCLARVRRAAASGDVDQALPLLEKMLESWPDHPTLLVEKSQLIQLSEHADLGEAKRALKQAIEMDRDSPIPWIELAYYRLCIEDRAKDAEAKFDHAVELGLRLVAEAVAGKIHAVCDQAAGVLPAGRLSEIADLQKLAQFLSQRHGKNPPPEIRKLRDRIAELEQLLHGGRKSERNGT